LFVGTEFAKVTDYSPIVNATLAALNTDGDSYTHTVDAKDLPTLDGIHYTTEGYYDLGGMWADAVDMAPFDEGEPGCGCRFALRPEIPGSGRQKARREIRK
jgi:hypothetical protein